MVGWLGEDNYITGDYRLKCQEIARDTLLSVGVDFELAARPFMKG